MNAPIRVIDTGTLPATPIPARLKTLHLPALQRRHVPFDQAILDTLNSTPHHLLFYSAYAVEMLARHRNNAFGPQHHYWAVGSRTAEAIGAHLGRRAHSPDIEDFAHLAALLRESNLSHDLIAFSLKGKTRNLRPIATALGVASREIPVYESIHQAPEFLRKGFNDFQPRWIAFTSSRGVDAYIEALGVERLQTLADDQQLFFATIGTPTAETLAHHGLVATLIAEIPDRAQLLESIAALESFSPPYQKPTKP